MNAIVSDPSDSERVWVACDLGVFESTDAGGSWAVFGTALPNALAVDLLFYAPDRLLASPHEAGACGKPPWAERCRPM